MSTVKKFTLQYMAEGFKVLEDDKIILDQPFNPFTGKPFKSKDEIDEYISNNCSWILNSEDILDKSNIDAIIKTITDLVTEKLNNEARLKRYDDIDSISKYLFIMPQQELSTYDIQLRYKLEAEKLANYSAECWAFLEDEMNNIISGQKTFISVDDIISRLPEINYED